MKKFIALLAVFAFITFGCSSEPDDSKDVKPILEVSPLKLSFKADGEEKTITITSNREWQIVRKDNWCILSQDKGANDAVIKVTATKNETAAKRYSTLTVRLASGVEKVVSLDQPNVPITPIPEFEGYPLPLMTINTQNGQEITDKENYIKGEIKIQARNEKGEITDLLFETQMTKDGIRGRGNSTWGMDKKPYKLKLDKAIEVMGMPQNKHWVLLANYSDKTLMRNALAFEISSRMGFPYTPRYQYVDVVLNGNYIGNYMLCEHIRIDKNRVDIAELTAKSKNITGGYLFEIDERRADMAESEYIYTKGSDMNGEGKLVVAISSPAIPDITPAQIAYATDHFQKIEDALYGRVPNPQVELAKYLDLKTFIDNFLINEMAKNVDGNLRLSTYMYKKEDNDLLYFGPVWDYDIAFGNVDYDDCFNTSGWHVRKDRWYKKFFEYPEFEQMARDRWRELRAGSLSDRNLLTYIDETALKLKASQKENFKRWNILNVRVWPNYRVTGSYNGEIDYLKVFLTSRAQWMDRQLR